MSIYERLKGLAPRGALVIIAAGLLLTVAVAWLSDEDLVSSKALQWSESYPDAIPTVRAGLSDGSVELASTGFDVTEENSAGETLFQVGGELAVNRPAVGPVNASCRVTTSPPTVNARTPNRPAAYPGGSEDLSEVPWPGDVPVNHSENGSPFSTVTLPTEYMGYGTVEGVEVEWGEWRTGTQEWHWRVPASAGGGPILIRFVSLWRSIADPAVSIACQVAEGPAVARLHTSGRLGP